ncbi:MAG: hypothetical protein Q8L57_03540, partial [bacterium]|nr:hypothetical protein [bacterium]
EQAAGQTRPSRGAEQKKCEYGCSDGACIPSPTPTSTFTPTPFLSPSPFACPYNCQAAKQKWEFGRGTYWVTECGENEIAEFSLFCPPTTQCYSCGFWGLKKCCVQVNSICCKTK